MKTYFALLIAFTFYARADDMPPRPPFEVDRSSVIRLNAPPAATAADTGGGAPLMPELMVLRMAAASEPDKKNIIADSAKIISPTVRTILAGDSVRYEIKPMMPVDSAMLFVRHSYSVVDTLGVFASPPYGSVWRYASIPDQDQIHLQFGYTLYLPDSITITSPALPHRWMLDRGITPSKKRYHIKQLTTTGEFEINGDLTKWKLSGAKEGFVTGGGEDIARFKLSWTAAKLHFVIEVNDNDITVDDFVELHLDFHRDRAPFAGVNHRSIRFSPRGQVNSFVVNLTKDGFVYGDSINALVSSETERAAVTIPSGYIIEAAIPITVLSDFEFPPSNIGFDVSVTRDGAFYSWAGARQFSRYSPSNWGGAKITQAASGIKIVFFSTFIITALSIVSFIVYTIINACRQRGEEQSENSVYSQLSSTVIGEIEKNHDEGNGDDDTDDDDDDDDVGYRRRWR